MRMILSALALLIPLTAHASTVELWPVDWQENPGKNLVVVRVVGDEFVDSDLPNIRKRMSEAKLKHKRVIGLMLANGGGSSRIGMAVAAYVIKNNIDVIVDSVCASACTMAAIAALGQGNLFILPRAQLGVHCAKWVGNGKAAMPETRAWLAQLRKWGAPEKILQATIDTPPDHMTYFDYDELLQLGAIRLGTPSVVSVSSWSAWLFGQ